VEWPTRTSKEVFDRLMDMWHVIHGKEEARRLELTREPDPGFVDTAYLWASGAALDEVLDEQDAPGDFVRSIKQLVDLMRQLAEVADPRLAGTISSALDGLHRGVVAYSSLEL
jgi:ATP-dependent RNA helicase HelY